MTSVGQGEGGSDGEAARSSDGPSAAKAAVEVITTVAGSTALLSALMLYFGWVRTRVLFDHFGIPVEILRFSTTDYLLRSAEVFFKPVIWATFALACLGAVSVCANFAESKGTKRARIAARVILAAVAGVSAVVGILGLLRIVDPGWGAVMLIVNGALLVVQYRMYRGGTCFRPPIIVLVVGLLLTVAATFWAVAIYAGTIGSNLARDIANGSSIRPAAIIYSQTDLRISGSQQSDAPESAKQRSWAFKYAGYKLLAYTNGRWFLIPEQWQPNSPTLILPDSDSVRVALSPR